MKSRKIIKSVICLALAAIMLPALWIPASAAGKKKAYDLTTELVYSYKTKQSDALKDIQATLKELESVDPELAGVWGTIMRDWMYANSGEKANTETIPRGLPQDDRLCIVVLGFQLTPEGEMTDELTGRCRTALEIAEKYPGAYIAVTGGGTAINKRDVTEAGLMAEWLEKNGIGKERLIVEDRSQTTAENAEFLGEIISEKYSAVTSIVIVTSDYHVPLGCLMFREYFLLNTYKNGARRIDVLTNYAYETKELFKADSIAAQALDVWSVAEYMKATG